MELFVIGGLFPFFVALILGLKKKKKKSIAIEITLSSSNQATKVFSFSAQTVFCPAPRGNFGLKIFLSSNEHESAIRLIPSLSSMLNYAMDSKTSFPASGNC